MADTFRAESLHGPVNNPQGHGWYGELELQVSKSYRRRGQFKAHLGYSDILHCALGPDCVNLMSGSEYEQSGLIDLCSRFGNLGQYGTCEKKKFFSDLSEIAEEKTVDVPCSRRYLPKVFRAGSETRVSIISSARWAVPMDRMQWWIRPGLHDRHMISFRISRQRTGMDLPESSLDDLR